MVFHSFRHIAQVSCKFGHFWRKIYFLVIFRRRLLRQALQGCFLAPSSSLLPLLNKKSTISKKLAKTEEKTTLSVSEQCASLKKYIKIFSVFSQMVKNAKKKLATSAWRGGSAYPYLGQGQRFWWKKNSNIYFFD